MNDRFRSFRRKFIRTKKSKKEIPYWLQLISVAAGILTSAAALILSIKANSLSEASIQLMKNDTSQQAQINQLREVIGELKNLAVLSNMQQQELITIATESKKGTTLSNDILGRVERQASITNQQLMLSLKTDSISANQSIIDRLANMRKIRRSFNKLVDIDNMVRIGTSASMTQKARIAVANDNKSFLENETSNPIVLTDKEISEAWFSYLSFVSNVEIEFKSDAFKDGSQNKAELRMLCNAFLERHLVFVNTMLKILNLSEQEYLKQMRGN